MQPLFYFWARQNYSKRIFQACELCHNSWISFVLGLSYNYSDYRLGFKSITYFFNNKHLKKNSIPTIKSDGKYDVNKKYLSEKSMKIQNEII